MNIFWKKSIVFFLIFEIMLFLMLYCFGPNGLQVLSQKKKQRADVIRNISHIKHYIAQLTQDIQDAQSSFAQEKIAREKLLMKKDNETVYFRPMEFEMFKLPELPYSYDSLEPYIDAQTMETHYMKHHQAYVDNLNKALQQHPELQGKTLEELLGDLQALPESIRLAVRNNGGGHFNHSLFWQMMKPDGSELAIGLLYDAIIERFGTFQTFKDLFEQAAKSCFGSGWAWLVLDEDGSLQVYATANQDTPISKGDVPLLGLDVWEHAYYLKYKNRRPDYIQAWWNIVNWHFVQEQYKLATGK